MMSASGLFLYALSCQLLLNPPGLPLHILSSLGMEEIASRRPFELIPLAEIIQGCLGMPFSLPSSFHQYSSRVNLTRDLFRMQQLDPFSCLDAGPSFSSYQEVPTAYQPLNAEGFRPSAHPRGSFRSRVTMDESESD
jgi:hypothetical protein